MIMQEHTLARETSGETKQHFVDVVLTLQKQHDLSDIYIIGLQWDMITTGMDTTTIRVEWTMGEMVRNPRVQKKVQNELDQVIGMEKIVKEAEFAKLPYLQYVVKEKIVKEADFAPLWLHPLTPLMFPHKAKNQRTTTAKHSTTHTQHTHSLSHIHFTSLTQTQQIRIWAWLPLYGKPGSTSETEELRFWSMVMSHCLN